MDRVGLLKGALRSVAVPAGAMLLVAGIGFSIGAAESALQYRDALPGGPREFETAIIFAVLGVVLFIAGLLTARGPVRRLMDLTRLIGHGTAGTATVTSTFETSTAVKGVPLWRLRYSYRDSRGAQQEGESDLLTPDEASEWRIGASGPILFDPARPATSAWLGRHAAKPDPAAPGPGARLWARLMDLARWVIQIAAVLAAIFVAGVIGELVPALKELDAWMADRQALLAYATGGAALLGLLVMLGGIILLIIERGKALDHTGVENVARSVRDGQAVPRIWRTSTYGIRGKAIGAEAHDEFTFAELKGALRSGALFGEKHWRRRLIIMCGATLMFFGVFGTAIVLSPLALKILLAAVVLYAVVRTTWGLIRA